MTDLIQLSAYEAARRIRNGELSAYALMRACLERIEAVDPQIQAWAFLDPEHALAMAAEADAKQRDGVACGPLHGVPVAIKDVIDTEDMPTQCGSPIFASRQPLEDAACVAALRAAGAVIIGKSVTTELASLTPGKTRNPRDLERTPGGSSSGSAAAVASGMVPLALGTQTAGSVIRPASFCGIFGFKPTLGFISRTGVLMQSHTLDTIGVYGRSLQDIALIAECLSGWDGRDEVSYRRAQQSLLAPLAQDFEQPPRLAFWRTPAWSVAEPATHDAFAELVEELGDYCQTIDLPAECNALPVHQGIVQSAENAAWYGDIYDRYPNQLSPAMRDRLAKGMQESARSYLEALTARARLYRHMTDLFERFDAVICPAAPGPAPKGIETTGNPIFNALWTYLGVPAVTLPLMEIDGLPVGVQLVGPRRDEAHLLRTANWLVKHLSG
jgi:Asp-tRNA(Asn)/Glu-tRNA(Gln) amidotransferase A subunit family amidase